MENTILESNICDLTEIRYIFISLVFIYSIPFDCISQKWTQLTYFEIMGNLALTYVNPQFWLLPNLETVIFDYCRINETSFNYNTFLGYGDKILKVSLDGNDFLCSGSININNGDYNGFRYLTNDKYNNSEDLYNLELFIETFDPCASVCSVSNGSYSLLSCRLSQWKDGVCDAFCNTEDCDYDGGDCIQACDTFNSGCTDDLLLNDECDMSCNTTGCAYDYGSCAVNVDANDTCFFQEGINGTDVETIVCYTAWTDDAWCDGSCNVEACGYDNDYCMLYLVLFCFVLFLD